MQDTRTPPVLDTIYEQVERAAAGYSDLVCCSDLTHAHSKEQEVTDCPFCSHLGSLSTDRRRNLSGALQRKNQERKAHDERPEKHRLWVQHVYTQFVASQNGLREQLELSHAREQKLHADLLVAEQENKSLLELIPTLRESNKKQREWEIIATNARACARDVREQLDRQTSLLLDKDCAIQSITEESQVAHVRLKNAEKKIACLITKLQYARDLRHRKMQKLLDEQARAQDRHKSEMRRVTQDAQDAQERLGILQEDMEKLRLSSDINNMFTNLSDSMLLEWTMAFESPKTATRDTSKYLYALSSADRSLMGADLFRLPPPPGPPMKADGNLRRGHRPRPSPPWDRIPRLDYGLPVDFGERV